MFNKFTAGYFTGLFLMYLLENNDWNFWVWLVVAVVVFTVAQAFANQLQD